MSSYKDTEFIQGSDNKPSEGDLVPGVNLREPRQAAEPEKPTPKKKPAAKKPAKKKAK